jgi:hypothetical protein
MAIGSGGPHIQVATFCEKVIKDQVGGNLSVIGCVSAVTNAAVGTDVPDEMPAFPLDRLTLAVTLWSDQAKGRYEIKIRPEAPNGQQLEPISAPIQLPGGAQGVDLIMQMNMIVEHEGTYWFDILFSPGRGEEDRLLSRIPLVVQYQPQRLPGG